MKTQAQTQTKEQYELPITKYLDEKYPCKYLSVLKKIKKYQVLLSIMSTAISLVVLYSIVSGVYLGLIAIGVIQNVSFMEIFAIGGIIVSMKLGYTSSKNHIELLYHWCKTLDHVKESKEKK